MEKNYSKLLWALVFVAFAAVSCWATAESLHLLLSTWPVAICWVVTIGFFIVASYGTKMVVEAFDQNLFIEHRGMRLAGGLLIFLLFWLVCSMPTNTHTFFYRTVINDKVSQDVSTTRGYLSQIVNNTNEEEKARAKVADLKNKVDLKLGDLKSEIDNDANPGFGPKAKEILASFAELLSVPSIQSLTYRNLGSVGRQKLYESYRQKIYTLYESRARNIIAEIMYPNPDVLNAAKLADKNLEVLTQAIVSGDVDLNVPEAVTGTGGVCDRLNDGYNAVKNGKNFVLFSSPSDEARYTAENPVTNVKRMVSVFDVWTDFVKGVYKGHGFMFWVIISILIDLVAFVAFDLAFKKSEF